MKRCPICARPFPADSERLCPEHGLPLITPQPQLGLRPGPLSGTVVDGRYLLGGLAGEGGMGTVYVAESLRIGRRVAVKVLHRELHLDAKMRMRLFREVQSTCRIRHPGVVEILDYGEDEAAGCYLVMEFLPGSCLRALFDRHETLPLPLVFKIMIQLSAALSATHAKGLIHRDLKPSNIRVLPDGRLKVLDFGLVKPYEPKRGESVVTITTGGVALGTPWYMSPEQATFKPLDPRSDIYTLGILLYEMLTGTTPFCGENPFEVVIAQRDEPVPLPRHLDPPIEVPAQLELLLLKLLHKDPDRRPQSMAELGDDLSGLAQELGIDITDVTVAVGSPPAGADADLDGERPTVPTTLPEETTVPVDEVLRALFRERMPQLCGIVAERLTEAFPRYRALEPEQLREGVLVTMRAAMMAFERGPQMELSTTLKELADQRTDQHFTPADVLGATLFGLSVCRPLIVEAAGGDISRFLELMEQVDQRVLPLYLKLAEYYFARFNARLIRSADLLARRNRQLERLRTDLEEQVKTASHQLIESERLKARVVDSISSGLLLLDGETQRVLMCNRAMERIFGIPAENIVQRYIDDVLRYVDGVPRDEFAEQIDIHRQVGLRKLRVGLHSGGERTVYVRGETFEHRRDQLGTLFVVDDVTEREQIIESFSRYVSRDVTARVLNMRGRVRPGGEERRALLFSCRLHNLQQLLADRSVEQASQLLTAVLLLVGEAVSPHGGVIESLSAEVVIVSFMGEEKSCAAALEAARELLQSLEDLNRERRAQEEPAVQIAIALHLGKVMVLHVGSEKRMAQTLMGEAVTAIGELQRAARASEILISDTVRAHAGDIATEEGPSVPIAPNQTTRSYRVRPPPRSPSSG